MDIARLIVDDLEGARECLAVAGNAPLQAADARTGALARHAELLGALRRAVEQAVMPALRSEGLMSPEVQDAYAALAAAQEEGEALAAGDGGSDAWMRRFAVLAEGHERMAAMQTGALLPAIQALPAPARTGLADAARGVRLGRS